MSAEGWRDAAACRTADTALFFAPRGATASWRAALAICETCPVRQRCLDYALDNRIRHGVWGGLTANSRRKLLADRTRTPAGEPERLDVRAEAV